MICPKCGADNSDEYAFCRKCGYELKTAAQSVSEDKGFEDDLSSQVKGKMKNRTLVIGLMAAGIVFIGSLLCLIVRVRSIYIQSKNDPLAQEEVTEVTEVSADGSGPVNETEGDGALSEESIDPEDQETPDNNDEDDEDDDCTYLICVPAEYMSLRETPGLGDDVIEELYAGTYLKWYGQSETIDDEVYYYVKVKDTDKEGYVAADYCVSEGYKYDETALGIVQTSLALYTYEDMVQDIDELVNDHPDILSKEIIGTSVDGRNIYALTLGNPDAQKHIMLQASIHGREYMNTQLVMRLIEYYCTYYNDGTYNNVTYKDLFDKTLFHIVPMSNPDGVTISQFGVNKLNNDHIKEQLYDCYEIDRWNLCYEKNSNGDYNWSDHFKEEDFILAESDNPTEITFDEYLTIWKANANGVDLNNNFDAGWYDIELKDWPSYGSFKGYYPVSEPETIALSDYAQKYDYECFVSYHSMGQLIYYDVKGNSPQNSEMSTKLSDLFKEQIKYDTVNTNKAYNVNLGGFGDWIQLSLDKPSITIESGKKPCPLQIQEFTAIWNRHRESWAMLADQFY